MGLFVTTDKSGIDLFLAGKFSSGTISFDSTVLLNTGGFDNFIYKRRHWAKSGTGSGNDIIHCISTDSSENVFFAGIFDSPFLVLGSDTLLNTGILYDLYLGKAGNLIAGRDKLQKSEWISVFPNPISDRVTIRTGRFLNGATLSVDDLQGKVVRLFTGLNGDNLVIKLDDLTPGPYSLRLTEGGRMIAHSKVIVGY